MSTLDRVFWQPLTVPQNSELYSSTLEGMRIELVEKILSHVEKSENKEMQSHVYYIRQVLQKHTSAVRCSMGYSYITLNPDLSLNVCPHDNSKSIPMDRFRETFSCMMCDKLSMRYVCLYSHLKRRYPQYD